MHIDAHLEFDVLALEQDDTVTVMVEMQAPQAREEEEAHVEHAAVVVLDRSGSMSGGRLAAAKRALVTLLDRLDDRDRFGLVSFDNQATVEIPAGLVGVAGKGRLRQAIEGLRTGGSTDMSSGFLRGLQEARRVATGAGATVVLLSDGHANSGIVDPGVFRDVAATAAGEGITTSTIGIGVGYDHHILAELATGGSGNHSFADGPDQAGAALSLEFEGLLSKTVQGASLMVDPAGLVQSVRILNDLPVHAVDGQIMAELGDFYAGETRRVVLAFDVPAVTRMGPLELAQLQFTFTELPALQQHAVKVPVVVNVVPAEAAAARLPEPEVTREKLFLTAQSVKREAEEALDRGDYGRAQEILRESGEMLQNLDEELLDPRLLKEAHWFSQSHDMVGSAEPEYLRRRLRSDRTRKSRGYNRSQGGEVGDDPGVSGSSDE